MHKKPDEIVDGGNPQHPSSEKPAICYMIMYKVFTWMHVIPCICVGECVVGLLCVCVCIL